MSSIYLKIRAGAPVLGEAYISGRIRHILDECGAPGAQVSGSMMQDYRIAFIPDKASDALLSRLGAEPGFDPQPF